MKFLADALTAVALFILGITAGGVLALSAAPPPSVCPNPTPPELVRVLDLTVYGLADKNTTNVSQHFQCRPGRTK